MLNLNTMNTGDKGGRPKVNENGMNENTEAGRESGSNIGRGGKTI
jgi:hypothetical protein